MSNTQWVIGADIIGGLEKTAEARVEHSSSSSRPLSRPGSNAFSRSRKGIERDLVIAHLIG